MEPKIEYVPHLYVRIRKGQSTSGGAQQSSFPRDRLTDLGRKVFDLVKAEVGSVGQYKGYPSQGMYLKWEVYYWREKKRKSDRYPNLRVGTGEWVEHRLYERRDKIKVVRDMLEDELGCIVRVVESRTEPPASRPDWYEEYPRYYKEYITLKFYNREPEEE